MGTNARDLAATEVKDDSDRRIDLDTAGSAATLGPAKDESPVPEIMNVVNEHAQLLPGSTDFGEVRFHALAPSVTVGLDSPRERREPFEVRRREFGEEVHIPSVERINSAPNDLHVLLRNTRSPGPFHPSWVPPTAPGTRLGHRLLRQPSSCKRARPVHKASPLADKSVTSEADQV